MIDQKRIPIATYGKNGKISKDGDHIGCKNKPEGINGVYFTIEPNIPVININGMYEPFQVNPINLSEKPIYSDQFKYFPTIVSATDI